METESKPSEMGTPLSSLSSLSDSDSDTAMPKDTGPRNGADSNINNDKTEWLATTRKRRSTAGNRMKSMLANEEPDSDLELLFAEDEDDQGFSDVDENGSDVQMDSSDDEDDHDNNEDDFEGEKELEKQAKERRAAQRKRKAQEAIPAKFRKRVRIDPTTRTPAAPTKPAPRPKKKSERTSWLPTAADLPTRASSRQTTRLSKEQLHQQMVEREARRLKQLAQMQKKAAKLEAMKKPPMTQEERLREAAIVEKRNSKSLNRWEEAEKQREEERRAKLAALHNRTLKGPVITFWSGIGEWMGRHMVIEEPAKEKRKRGEKAKSKEKDKVQDKPHTEEKKDEGQHSTTSANSPDSKTQDKPQTSMELAVASEAKDSGAATPDKVDDGVTHILSTAGNGGPLPPPKTEEVPRSMAMPPPPQPPPTPPGGLAAPSPPPSTPSGSASTNAFMTPPPGLSRPPESKPSGVLAAPVLAPPPGIGVNGAAPPMMGYGNPKSNVLAPPNTSQGAIPPTLSATAPPHTPSSAISSLPSKPSPVAASTYSQATLQPIFDSPTLPTKSASPDASGVAQDSAPQPQPQPQPSTGARNAIIFQNFDNNALKDRNVQTQIIFGRKMNKLSKPSPAPLCVITHHPARYRDPRTGLPYSNAYAYREIQRLTRGEYRWSQLLGAWVGSGTYAARGVPERFLNPDKKGPETKATPSQDTKPVPQASETKPKETAVGVQISGEKTAGIEQSPIQPEPNKASQSNTTQSSAPPATTKSTGVGAPTALTAPTQTPQSHTQVAVNPIPTTGNPPGAVQKTP
ncbi:hypothetical protein F66182_4596 [Fusarium sp. NRRL 66182]|nr:hypothetical protein F66182_4596 [Fusarium sp. NRRL 66182]